MIGTYRNEESPTVPSSGAPGSPAMGSPHRDLVLVDPFPAPAIAPSPEGGQGTRRSVVVDPFLARAADDPVHHRDRAHAKPVHVSPVTAKVCVLAKALRNTRFVKSTAPDPQ